MFGILRDTPISLKKEMDKAEKNGYKISFLEIPKEIQEAFILYAEENRKKDGANTFQVENEVFKKTEFGRDGNTGMIVYKLRCTTFGERD